MFQNHSETWQMEHPQKRNRWESDMAIERVQKEEPIEMAELCLEKRTLTTADCTILEYRSRSTLWYS